MEFRALADTGEVSLNGDKLSPEAMRQLAEQTKGIPLRVNFNPEFTVGRVEHAEVTDRGLVVEGILDDKATEGMVAGLYCVPGFSVKPEDIEIVDGAKVIRGLYDVKYGLTSRPADFHLTPIEKK